MKRTPLIRPSGTFSPRRGEKGLTQISGPAARGEGGRRPGEGLRIFAMALAILLIAISSKAITVDAYIASLGRIQSLLAAGQTDAARSAARALTGVRIDHPTAPF